MLNDQACVCQQENVPCFSKGCRDTGTQTSKALEGSRGWSLLHFTLLSNYYSSPKLPNYFFEKVRDEEGTAINYLI